MLPYELEKVLFNRSISKRFLKSDAAPQVEKKSSTFSVFQTLDTGFLYLSPANTLHDCFVADHWYWVWKGSAEVYHSALEKKNR